MKRKRRIRKGLIILLSILSIIFVISSIYIKSTYHVSIFEYLFQTTEDKLINIGYSKEETCEILKLEDETIFKILNRNYEENLIHFINHKNFKKEFTILYLDEIKKSNLSIDDTIFLVNHPNYSLDITYDTFIVSLLKEPYYLNKNLNRYLAYKNKNLSAKEIVSSINTNRDYEYYTNTKKTDTSTYQMLVNKYYYLEKNYKPTLVTQQSIYGRANVQMEERTYEQFKKMFAKAKEKNLTLYVNSAYRSYSEQEEVFKEYEKTMKEHVLDYAAKPGYSEHQTGLALDIFKPGTTTKTFENTKEFKWLQEHAFEYGFILRYPKGKENITGYDYESWHYRYVGEEIATYIHQNNITFDEYYAFFLE